MRHAARRLLATLLVVPGSAALLVAGTGGAQAAPATCGYPVAVCEGPTLSLSTSLAEPVEVVDATGAKFLADKRVTLILQPLRSTSGAQAFAPRRSYVLKTVRTGSDGTFATSVTTPKTSLGKYDVVAVNGTPDGFTDPTAPLTIRADGDGNRSPDKNNNETTTAFTGFNLMWLLLLAAVLLGAGGYAARRGKRADLVRSIHG